MNDIINEEKFNKFMGLVKGFVLDNGLCPDELVAFLAEAMIASFLFFQKEDDDASNKFEGLLFSMRESFKDARKNPIYRPSKEFKGETK